MLRAAGHKKFEKVPNGRLKQFTTTPIRHKIKEENNSDHLVTMECSDGTFWALVFMWVLFLTHTMHLNIISDKLNLYTLPGKTTSNGGIMPTPPKQKHNSGTAQGTWQRAQGSDLAQISPGPIQLSIHGIRLKQGRNRCPSPPHKIQRIRRQHPSARHTLRAPLSMSWRVVAVWFVWVRPIQH